MTVRQPENGSKIYLPEGLVFTDSLSVSLSPTFSVDSANQLCFIHSLSSSIIKKMKSLILKALDRFTADMGENTSEV